MKRLLTRTVVAVAVLAGVTTFASAQDEAPADPALRRAQERAARQVERAEAQAQRAADRAERRLNRRFGDHGGAHILIGQDYELPDGSSSSEKIVLIGGTATINGHAESDVVVVGGSLRLGPKAVVDGDVGVMGGQLDRDPSAHVGGDVDVAHISLPAWSWAWTWPLRFPDVGPFWWAGAAVAFTIGRFVLVLLLSLVLVTIAPQWTSSIAARVVTGPGVSALAGFAAEIFFAPALICLAVALVITIVGIPLLAGLPLLAALFALLWVGGYAVVAGLVGARLRGADWYVQGVRPLDVFIGSCLLSSITLIGQVLMVSPGWVLPFAMLVRGTGWMIEYIAWTVGLGAALTAWVRPGGFNRKAYPPGVPPLPSAAPSAM